jgi:hypothetical protein
MTASVHHSARTRILLAANACGRPRAGGHRSALAQWSGGLRRGGHEVTFVDRATSLSAGKLREGSDDFDLVLNVMGFLPRDEPHSRTPWVFVDIDPGYPQMWRELGLADMLDGHDGYVTIGENVGRDDCLVPSCGLEWITTPPPVVLGDWPVTPAGPAFSSVATWRSPYGTVSFQGATYGSRVHEFRKFIELPRLVDAELELALDIDAAELADLRALDAHGWRLVDPRAVAGSPTAYRSYIQRSRAEFCVAQNMYVANRCGWLSDRSVCYLASGKPVLAQDTGFSSNYPVGDGLLAFSTLEEAAMGICEIERNYEHHSAAARLLAEEYFDSDKVLPRLLERLGLARESITS